MAKKSLAQLWVENGEKPFRVQLNPGVLVYVQGINPATGKFLTVTYANIWNAHEPCWTLVTTKETDGI